MAALQESVDKAKASRGEDTGTDAQVHEMPAKKTTAKTSAKKTAAKQSTTAEKTVGKKATAKKAAARKPRGSA
ncbi:hypothetical protein ACFZDK_50455 [Streptomyces sp. NPDC007901]|uniref:hypothetical protein n=1 Tax=Streptomyces sp. NPDC007901 TaxID=3364785 RepID=UPI0036EE3F97